MKLNKTPLVGPLSFYFKYLRRAKHLQLTPNLQISNSLLKMDRYNDDRIDIFQKPYRDFESEPAQPLL